MKVALHTRRAELEANLRTLPWEPWNRSNYWTQKKTFAVDVPSHLYGEVCCDPEIEEILLNVREYLDELLGDTAKVSEGI